MRQQHHKRMKKFMYHGNYDRNPVCLGSLVVGNTDCYLLLLLL